MTIFLWPESSFSLMRSRSRLLPSPKVIRPSMSITVTPPTSRLTDLKLIANLSWSFPGIWERKIAASVLACLRNLPPAAFRHYDFGASCRAHQHGKLVHKRLHQEDSAPRITQHIFIFAGIGNVGEVKSGSLVGHADFQFLGKQFEYDVDFSLAMLFVAVLKGVHYGFMHGEADLVLVIFIEAGGDGNAHSNVFGESDTLHE